MRPLPWTHLEPRRIAGPRGEDYGSFLIPHPPTGVTLRVIVSASHPELPRELQGWEHVSVSLPKRCPNWQEMTFVCGLFWGDDETVMQLRPPKSEYISNHPFCLHWFRPVDQAIPRPPNLLVGVKDAGELRDHAHARRVQDEVVSQVRNA